MQGFGETADCKFLVSLPVGYLLSSLEKEQHCDPLQPVTLGTMDLENGHEP